MKSKHSGMDDMVELVEAELQLETFLEQQGGHIFFLKFKGNCCVFHHILTKFVFRGSASSN